MILKDCIQLCATLLNLSIADAEAFSLVDVKDYMLEEEDMKLLIKCGNLIQSELANDYFPLKHSQILNCNDGKIDYFAFERAVVEVVQAIYRGSKLKFNQMVGYLGLPISNGEVEVHYNYRPKSKKFSEELEVGSPKIDLRMIAYGMAAEFCLMRGNYDDATMWDSRYKNSITANIAKKCEMRVKARGWY